MHARIVIALRLIALLEIVAVTLYGPAQPILALLSFLIGAALALATIRRPGAPLAAAAALAGIRFVGDGLSGFPLPALIATAALPIAFAIMAFAQRGDDPASDRTLTRAAGWTLSAMYAYFVLSGLVSSGGVLQAGNAVGLAAGMTLASLPARVSASAPVPHEAA